MDTEVGKAPSMIHLFLGLFLKDIRLLTRGVATLVLIFLYGLIMLAILSFSVGGNPGAGVQQRPDRIAWIWIVFWFTGEVLFHESFQHERDANAYYPVLAALRRPGWFFWAKVVAQSLALLIVHAVLLILFTVFFDLEWGTRFPLFSLIWAMAIGTYVIAGAFLAVVTLDVRHRALFYPLLLFPVMMGVFMLAARASVLLFSDYASFYLWQPMRWLAVALVANTILAGWLAPRMLQPGVAAGS